MTSVTSVDVDVEFDLRRGVLPSAVSAMHCTPCVEMSRLVHNTPGAEGRLVVKLEYFTPGLSKKDRIARQMIEDAEAAGHLQPGQPVIELTSGNTGTGLAIACAVKQHPFIAVMSKGNSVERARMMRALGAEVVLVDQAEGGVSGQVSGKDLEAMQRKTEEVCRDRRAYRADQFELDGNRRAHELHTGPELWRQCQRSGVRLDAFCDFAGSGGTFAGITTALRAHDPTIQCYLVEPASCPVLAERAGDSPQRPAKTAHRIQGGGYELVDLTALRGVSPTGYLQVTDDEAIDVCRRLACEEGVFAGFSAGANVAAALQLLKGPLKGKTVACLVCDSGLKYLSTDLWPRL